MLKAFFNTDIRFGVEEEFRPNIPAEVLASDDEAGELNGVLRLNPDSPDELDVVDGSPTIEDELHKLATNMSIGRD